MQHALTACKALTIPRTPFGTNLLHSGVDVVVVAQLMGHRRLDTTRLVSGL